MTAEAYEIHRRSASVSQAIRFDDTSLRATCVVYAPIAADIPSVYSGLFRHPGLQSFNPNVGAESAGWVGPTSTPGLFQAYINFRTASNIFTIQVSGLPSADAAKSAVQKLAGSL